MTSNQMPDVPPVVVGVDGSDESWQAIHAAAWEARARRLPLVLTHGYPADPYTWYGWAPLYAGPAVDSRAAATALVDETANEVRAAYPDLLVGTDVRVGTGAHALIGASQRARLVVVGSRGRGGFAGLSIGSTAAQTAAHATCPVLVVRPVGDDRAPSAEVGPTTPRPVLVGVDGSSTSENAIEFAFEEASLRRVPLIALYVWWLLPTHNLGPDLPGHYGLDEAREEARRLLAEIMAGWTGKFPDVPLQSRPVQGMNPSHELIDASREAGLVVVGSRGRGGFAGLLLGSVGRDLIGHALCPVAVVHPAPHP
jgi:nucleotide-binding universal stress UspA family protein